MTVALAKQPQEEPRQKSIPQELTPVCLPPCMAENYDYLVEMLFPEASQVQMISREALAKMCTCIRRADWSDVPMNTCFSKKMTCLPFNFFYLRKGQFCLDISTPIVSGASASIRRGVMWCWNHCDSDKDSMLRIINNETRITSTVTRALVALKQARAVVANYFPSKHLVKTHATLATTTTMHLFQEAYDGDLTQFFKGQRVRTLTVTTKILTQAFIGIAEDLADLHRNKLVHRDVKPGNSLLKFLFDQEGKLYGAEGRLTDFEFTDRIDAANACRSLKCTPSYAPPEFFEGFYYTNITGKRETLQMRDIWSLGMTMYIVLELYVDIPWGSIEDLTSPIEKVCINLGGASNRLVNKLMGAFRFGPLAITEGSLELLCERMLAFDPAHRPTIDTVVMELKRIYKDELSH